jgi:hypothetical protein
MTEAGREELLERYIAKWRAYERQRREVRDKERAADGERLEPDDDLFLHLIAYFDPAPARIGDLIAKLADLSTELLGPFRFGGTASGAPERFDLSGMKVTTTPAKLPAHPAINLLNRDELRSILLCRRGRDDHGKMRDNWSLQWEPSCKNLRRDTDEAFVQLSVNIDVLSVQRKPKINAVARQFFRIVNEAGAGGCFHAFGDISVARDTCRGVYYWTGGRFGSVPFPRHIEREIWFNAGAEARRSRVRSLFWANYLGPAQAARLGDFERFRHEFYSLTCGTVFGVRPLPGYIERYQDGSILIILRVADDRLCGIAPRTFDAAELEDSYRWLRLRFMDADLFLY